MIWEISAGMQLGHLHHIDSPPKQLFVRAQHREAFDQLMAKPRVAIVGTRMVTTYGQAVTARLARELAAHGVVIISGLAIGIDGIAHTAALDADGFTIAVLPTPVEQIYPRSHQALAQRIIDNQGALVSEYPDKSPLYKTSFVARNRIVAGLADALLITEAAENSGTMHTATFALRQGLTVFTVPGNITSPTSAGTNNLIKQGATPVTQASDILDNLKLAMPETFISMTKRVQGSNSDEQLLIELMENGVTDGNELLRQSQLDVSRFNHHMTMMEITAKIRALGANQWGLA